MDEEKKNEEKQPEDLEISVSEDIKIEPGLA